MFSCLFYVLSAAQQPTNPLPIISKLRCKSPPFRLKSEPHCAKAKHFRRIPFDFQILILRQEEFKTYFAGRWIVFAGVSADMSGNTLPRGGESHERRQDVEVNFNPTSIKKFSPAFKFCARMFLYIGEEEILIRDFPPGPGVICRRITRQPVRAASEPRPLSLPSAGEGAALTAEPAARGFRHHNGVNYGGRIELTPTSYPSHSFIKKSGLIMGYQPDQR